MRFKRTLGIMLTLLAILPGLTRNFTPQVEALSSPEEKSVESAGA